MPPRRRRVNRPSPSKPQKPSLLPRSRASSSSERSSSPDPLDVISDKGSISGRRSSSVYIGSVKHQRQQGSSNSNNSKESGTSSASSSNSDSTRSSDEEHQSGIFDVTSDTSDQEGNTSLKKERQSGEESEDEWSSFRDPHDKGKKQNSESGSRIRQASDTRSTSQISQYPRSESDHPLIISPVKSLMAGDHAMEGGEVKAEVDDVRARGVEREQAAGTIVAEHGMGRAEGNEASITRQDAKFVSKEQGDDPGQEAQNSIPVNRVVAGTIIPSNAVVHESSSDLQQAPVTAVLDLSTAGNDVANGATAQNVETSMSQSEENATIPLPSSSLSEEDASKKGVTDVHLPEISSQGIEGPRETGEEETIAGDDTLQAGIAIPLPSSSLSEYDMSREGAINDHLPDADADFTRTDTAEPSGISKYTSSAPSPGPAQNAIEDQAMALASTPSTATNGPSEVLFSSSEPLRPANSSLEDCEMAVDNGQEKQLAELPAPIPADMEEEGEEELDLDTAPSPEAESEAEVGNENTDVEMDGSSVVTDHVDLGSLKKVEPEMKIRKKPGPKPKGTSKKVEAAVKKATKGAKGKPKVDGSKGSSKNKNRPSPDSTLPSPSKASNANELTRQESPDPASDRTYCVCRKKESEDDEDVLMVGCESCDDWFHAACVGLSEDQVKNLDVYICRSCERSTKQKTIYKKTCKRDTCDRGLGDRESKFCSDLCAYKHFKAFSDSMTNKKTLKAIATSFSAYPKPVSVNIVHYSDTGTQVAPGAQTDDHTKQMMAAVQAQITATTAALDIVKKRQQILQIAIDTAEGLAPIIVQPEERSGKGRRKGGGGPTEDKQCGWDPKLLWDDEEVSKWSENQEEQGDEQHCGLAKRRCDKHPGWQKTAAFSLEVEEVQLVKKHDELVSQQDMLTKSVEANAESEKTRSAFRERLVAKKKA